MPKTNLTLVIPKAEGFRHDRPLTSGAKLVNPETREEVPGVSHITLQLPTSDGMVRCTAEIHLGAIEVTEPNVPELS